MKDEQCPICYSNLEVVDCAPCHDCGHLKEEVEHFNKETCKNSVFEIYKGLRLQLCKYCAVDFGSYKAEYLGLADARRLGYEHFQFVSSVENPVITKDKYCPTCEKRLKFLRFLKDLRETIAKEAAINKK